MNGRQQRIDELLRADADNVGLSPHLLRNLHPWAYDGIQHTGEMYGSLARRLQTWGPEERAQQELESIARRAELTNEELGARLIADGADGINGAAEAYRRLSTLWTLRILFLACQRHWAWGMTDLLRMRISGAQGNLRLQAESVGLIALFVEDEALADRWFAIRTEPGGKAFFRDTQQRLRDKLRNWDLLTVYDLASSAALHMRLAGLSRSLNFAPGAPTLPDQEFDPNDAYSYHLASAHYHVTQIRIVRALGSTLPEVADDGWRTDLNEFTCQGQAMWRALEQRYLARMRDDDLGDVQQAPELADNQQ